MILSLLGGLLAGSIPTADWLAGRRGVDLRRGGSGNPGANNAMRLGGWKLAALILGTEMVKSAAVVLAAQTVSDSWAVAAGVGAVAGNIYNPWHRFRGGQGLGSMAGVLAAAWPAGLATGLVVIGVMAILFKSSRPATIIAMSGLVLAATQAGSLWMPWGVETLWLPLSGWMFMLVVPKQVLLIRRAGRTGSPG